MAKRLLSRMRSSELCSAYCLQQRRTAIVKPPMVDRYEVVDQGDAERLREELERDRGSRVMDRYNKVLDGEPRQGSFRLRSDKYMRPFTLDIHFTSKYVHAAVMHRTQHRVVAAASSNSKDMRAMLPSRCDLTACRVIGETLADRAKEADVYAVIYLPRKMERLEGRHAAVVEAVANSGISVYHADKGILLVTKACDH